MAFNLKIRAKAAGMHLIASLIVVVVVAILVFGIWFPGPYRAMSGGTSLLMLVALVDIVVGPILTFAVFNTQKSRSHLRRDIATIAFFQLVALAYGLHSVYLARPVALAFEHDRFRVISAAEVVQGELPQALPEFQELSLAGPQTLAVRKAVQGRELNESLAGAVLEGVDTSQRPKFWIPYGTGERAAAFKAGRPVSLLVDKYPDSGQALNALLTKQGIALSDARFLPVRARNDAVAVLNLDGSVAGFLPYDGYF